MFYFVDLLSYYGEGSHVEIPGGGLWHFQSYFSAREIDGISPSKTDWTTAKTADVQSVLEGEIPSISRAEK